MDRVYSFEQRPFDRIRYAAVAIKSVDVEQRHIGILHRLDSSSDVLLLHLAWRHDLRNQESNDTDLWIDPLVPDRRLRQVAARCRQIFPSYPSSGLGTKHAKLRLRGYDSRSRSFDPYVPKPELGNEGKPELGNEGNEGKRATEFVRTLPTK